MSRSGPLPIVHTVKGNKAYQSLSANVVFQEVAFGFGATQLLVENDSGADVEYSFDGSTVKGKILKYGNHSRTLSSETSIFVRTTSATGTVLIHAY